MTIFKTETGSTYEIDMENMKARRIEGVEKSTPRVGTDGEWKTFEAASEPIVGRSVTIIWAFDVPDGQHPPIIETIARSTITSRVVLVKQVK